MYRIDELQRQFDLIAANRSCLYNSNANRYRSIRNIGSCLAINQRPLAKAITLSLVWIG